MKSISIFQITILSFCLIALTLAQGGIELSKIQTLTLNDYSQTSSRRGSSIPQLRCVGGSAQQYKKYFPKVVQCSNQGIDSYGNVQWKCEAQLDEHVQFGRITVNCEGYRHPGDKLITPGSCGVEYDLDFTDKGMKKYVTRRHDDSHDKEYEYQRKEYSRQQQQRKQEYQQQQEHATYNSNVHDSSSGGSFGVVLMVVIVIGVLIYVCSKMPRQPTPVRGRENPQPQSNNYENIYPSAPRVDDDENIDRQRNRRDAQNSSSSFFSSSGNDSGVSLGAAAASTVAGFVGGYALGSRNANNNNNAAQGNMYNNAAYGYSNSGYANNNSGYASMYPNSGNNSNSYSYGNNNSGYANMYPSNDNSSRYNNNNYNDNGYRDKKNDDDDDKGSSSRTSVGYGGSNVR